MSLADQILSRTGLRETTVEVPEWGCSVIVRAMSAADRSALENRAIKAGGPGTVPAEEINATILARCVLDPETHAPVFTHEQALALVKSPEHDGAAVMRIANMIFTGSGLGNGAVEEVTRNFSSGRTPTSSTTRSATPKAGRSSRS